MKSGRREEVDHTVHFLGQISFGDAVGANDKGRSALSALP